MSVDDSHKRWSGGGDPGHLKRVNGFHPDIAVEINFLIFYSFLMSACLDVCVILQILTISSYFFLLLELVALLME